VNEGTTRLAYSLTDLSLPFIGSLVIVATWTCIVKVWTCKGMISKLVPPLSGLIGLVMAIGYTTMALLELYYWFQSP
jgi:hypothetical protein